jgi:hypothetical protein
MSNEHWRPVVGFEGLYEVSDQGRVRNKHGQVLRHNKITSGYVAAHLYRGGQRHIRTVHRLVLEAFVALRPQGMECRHIDNDKTNNRLGNLSWASHTDNEADKLRFGTRLRGERIAGAKLTADAARAIRQRRGEPQADLAAEFGCTFSNVSAIQRGKSWRHV